MKLKPPLDTRNQPAQPPVNPEARGFRLRFHGKGGSLPTVPAIVVRGSNGANLIENLNTDESDGTFFGRVTVGAGGLSRTFSIHNVGTAPLKLGCAGIEGAGADEFAVIAVPASIVAPGGSTTFTIHYRGACAGTAVALVLIPSNDATERPYLFLVEGHAEAAHCCHASADA